MSPFESQPDARVPLTGRRKRPRVSKESRKRASRACDACRRLKEKCEGGYPCTRCSRLHRTCGFDDSAKTREALSRRFEGVRFVPDFPAPSGDQKLTRWSPREEFFDVERVKVLETLLQHYIGRSTLDKATLAQLAESLQDEKISSATPISIDAQNDTPDQEPSNDDDDHSIDLVSSIAAVYTGELSHSHFSAHFQRKLKEGLQDSHDEEPPSISRSRKLDRASYLWSKASVIASAAAIFPPREVADFLIDIFFDYAQTNYFYVDEQTLREKLDVFFLNPISINISDSSWVWHDDGGSRAEKSALEDLAALSPDDSAALSFYRAAKSLMPDIITIASIEIVQAFLLLGVYALPIDPDGLSYTYFGVALRLAILNGTHRKLRHHRGVNPRSGEIRNRIWWTTYTLEKRVCVLHGRPVSISKSDVDAEQPSAFPALQNERRIDTLPKILAMIRLTTFLEEARDKLSFSRKKTRRTTASAASFNEILRLKKDLHDYWESLSSETYCRDLTPNGRLFRFNTHLALSYQLAHIFIGRTFIFNFPPYSNTTTPDSQPERARRNSSEIRGDLVEGCIQSALSVIDLCKSLQNEAGLARASYTEFTTCRAALLVILAQRMHERSARLRKASEEGLTLIKSMSLGIYGANAEKLEIEAMETALRRLDEGIADQKQDKSRGSGAVSAYDTFRNWAMLWKNDSGDSMNLVASNSSPPSTELPVSLDNANFVNLDSLQNLGWDMYSPSFPFEYGDFSQIMG